ncbi:MAG: hypothetical protein ACXWLR_06940, partial [Myxococcales bacterium]
PFFTLANTVDTSILLDGLERAAAHTYLVRAYLADGGTLDSPAVTASTLTETIDQENGGLQSGDSVVSGRDPVVQSFTAGMAGKLNGIELAIMVNPNDRNASLILRDQAGNQLGSGQIGSAPPTSSGAFPLSSPVRSGTFFDLSSLGVVVAPGTVLSVVVGSTSSYLDTPDLYPGGTKNGTSRDLVFRTWVTPAQ